MPSTRPAVTERSSTACLTDYELLLQVASVLGSDGRGQQVLSCGDSGGAAEVVESYAHWCLLRCRCGRRWRSCSRRHARQTRRSKIFLEDQNFNALFCSG